MLACCNVYAQTTHQLLYILSVPEHENNLSHKAVDSKKTGLEVCVWAKFFSTPKGDKYLILWINSTPSASVTSKESTPTTMVTAYIYSNWFIEAHYIQLVEIRSDLSSSQIHWNP